MAGGEIVKKKLPEEKSKEKKKKKRTLSADGHDFRLQTGEQELHPSYRAMNHEARLKVSEATLIFRFSEVFSFLFFLVFMTLAHSEKGNI